MTMSAIIEGTTMVSRPPVPRLEAYLGCYWTLVHAPGASVQTIPDASAYLVIEIPDAAAPECLIAGPRLKTMRSAPTRRSEVVGVRLRPGVAYLLAQTPIHQIVNRREPLARFLGPCADGLARKMAEAPSADARFDLLEAFCLEHIASKRVNECVGLTLRLLEESAGAMQIREVARHCAVSQRQLERLLRTWVGMSPKRLARIARFQTVLGRAQRKPQWTHVAAEHDYADQAHMIHEFSAFAGESPARFTTMHSGKFPKTKCD
jgi:AraC-like DNA-binding protein